MIQEFNFIELLKLIVINIIPLIIVIYIGQIKYFKIISMSKETSSSSKTNNKEQIKVRTPIKSLVKKELSKFFSTPVYMFNTSFGILIMVIASIRTFSSISLEDKSFNITKSLPVKEEKILLSKIIMSNVITLPLMLLSDLIFIIKFDLSLIDI